MDAAPIYVALLAGGFLGSIGHCPGMCGPLLLMVGIRLGQEQGLRALPSHSLYHGARVTVYALLGALAGWLGSVTRWGEGLSHWGGVLGIVLGASVVLMGVGYAGWLPILRSSGGNARLTRWMSGALKRGGASGILLLGALNGILPCCLTYGALLAAASTGSSARSALAMLLFGLGTLPALVAVGIGAAAIGSRPRRALARASAALLILLGSQLVLRGLAALGAVPSAHLGKLVLW